jgi:hypothetical protein
MYSPPFGHFDFKYNGIFYLFIEAIKDLKYQ